MSSKRTPSAYMLLACLIAAVALMAGCASAPDEREGAIGDSPWAEQSVRTTAGRWSHHRFPGKAPSEYRFVRKDGRDAIGVRSASAASMLRTPVRIEPADLGSVRFSWMVPALMEEADLARRDLADAPVRVILAFEGDRKRFSQRDAALSELARALTGEEMPYATLMYVWCHRRAAGTVIKGPRTDRIRKLVVQGGRERLGEWLEYERDVRADFERAFGEPPGALVGMAIMTDSDNTRGRAQAWYGPILHQTRPRAKK